MSDRQRNRGFVSPKNAVAFVESHGIVLESGRGPISNLAEAVAGSPIKGSWWGHEKGHEIFATTCAVRASPDVLVCRLLDGKVTYIHRRLWPALVRLADKLGKDRLGAIHEEHTASGKHQIKETPFPDWVSPDVRKAGQKLSEEQALEQLGEHTTVVLDGS